MGLADEGGTRLTLSLTMTADEWTALAAQLPDDGTNAGRFNRMIRELVNTLTRRIAVTMETTGFSAASSVGVETGHCPICDIGPHEVIHRPGCTAPGAAVRTA